MHYYKITNFIQVDGSADYKGVSVNSIITGTQVYPHNLTENNICLVGSTEEKDSVGDLVKVTKKEYNKLKGEILAAHPNNEMPSEMERLQQENLELKLALAEMAEVQEQHKLETQLALAELAEAMAGGVYIG